MPMVFDEDMDDAIAAREVERALLVEFKADGETFRAWNQEGDLVESVVLGSEATWSGLGKRLELPNGITMAVDLRGETAVLLMDASRINDGSDFLGGLVDDDWHQREIVIREILCTANFAAPIGVLNEWYATMDRGEFLEGPEGSVWTLSCESGGFQYYRTNQHRRSDSNQQRFAPGDRAFEWTAIQVLQSIPFRTGWGKVAGAK